MTSSPSKPVERPKYQRMFIAFFVAVTLGATGYSLYANLSRQSATEANARTALEHGLEKLEIYNQKDIYPFLVEVMRTDAERSKGLMFRQSMPQDRGMLFDFKNDMLVMMWMKNTYIPLDMVFILADGTIHRVERNTEPMSERTISSGIPVRAVLELNAGVAERLQLKPGDRIRHPMFPAK